MANLFYNSLAYINYQIKAKSEKSIHSPFVFDLYTKVIKDTKTYPEYSKLDNIVKYFKQNKRIVEVTDFGAGGNNGYQLRFEKISNLYKQSSITPKYGRLLFRLVQHFKPKDIIEIGTSIGMSGSYIALANKESSINSFEGCSIKSQIAKGTFDKLKLDNVNVNIGSFSSTFNKVLNDIENIDFAFIDGLHTEANTLEFFELLYKKINKNSFFIFDDIYWSEGMQNAWNKIVQDPRVTVSIDLFRFGIVFFNPDFSKQNFKLRY